MSTPTVSARLERARSLVGDLSARELDRLAGRPQGTCAIIEGRDQRSIRHEIALSYAAVLGVPMAWLVLGEGPEPTADSVRAAVERARRAQDPNTIADDAAPLAAVG